MRNQLYLFIFLLLSGFSSQSQIQEITLDYLVTYEVPNNKKGTTDTLQIGFAKSGGYLFTDSDIISKEMDLQMFGKINPSATEKSSLLLNTSNANFYFNYEVNGVEMFISANLSALIPEGELDPMDESVEIISEKTNSKTNILGKLLDTYLVFPSNRPEQPATLVVDDTREVDNSALLNKIIQLLLKKSQSSGGISVDLPQGLILSVTEPSGRKVLEAIKIKDSPTIIEFTHSFKVRK